MKTAFFPGNFDPPTSGHLELIERAATLFERLYLGLPDKNEKWPSSFDLMERKALLDTATKHLSNVEVVFFKGLSVDYAKNHSIDVLLRGLRNSQDFDYEYQMAASNRQMTGIETVFFVSSPKYIHLSSTLVRQIARSGHRLHGFVPDSIEEVIFKKLSSQLQSL